MYSAFSVDSQSTASTQPPPAPNACVELVLYDRGTRLGQELWRCVGLVVKIPYCDDPCVLTLRSSVRDPFIASHGIANFMPDSSRPQTPNLSSSPLAVRSPMGSRPNTPAKAFNPAMLTETQRRLDSTKFM